MEIRVHVTSFREAAPNILWTSYGNPSMSISLWEMLSWEHESPRSWPNDCIHVWFPEPHCLAPTWTFLGIHYKDFQIKIWYFRDGCFRLWCIKWTLLPRTAKITNLFEAKLEQPRKVNTWWGKSSEKRNASRLSPVFATAFSSQGLC